MFLQYWRKKNVSIQIEMKNFHKNHLITISYFWSKIEVNFLKSTKNKYFRFFLNSISKNSKWTSSTWNLKIPKIFFISTVNFLRRYWKFLCLIANIMLSKYKYLFTFTNYYEYVRFQNAGELVNWVFKITFAYIMTIVYRITNREFKKSYL